ncbi:hypothetical protein GIY30_09725 [Gordonia sp. HNM0687]|uniref:Uncharacterized protein n=1 Tax=Gordonia mangrovi TaxID=2665643 RepID=A0A6L7GSK4_9ACTN|nr:hypothetical protein [Gordonia mangrovi]MDY6810815.1 hypothetical protein [Actinomycetota bacterium]MXP21625.1 hypothetical protein [Gordonia mangrovi]UVF80365.1 hypothetical protein NWF22_11320 [Gordonia mangrovi]
MPPWFSCRNAAHDESTKGQPMLTGLTQFFNDAYLFGGDLLSVAFSFTA